MKIRCILCSSVSSPPHPPYSQLSFSFISLIVQTLSLHPISCIFLYSTLLTLPLLPSSPFHCHSFSTYPFLSTTFFSLSSLPLLHPGCLVTLPSFLPSPHPRLSSRFFHPRQSSPPLTIYISITLSPHHFSFTPLTTTTTQRLPNSSSLTCPFLKTFPVQSPTAFHITALTSTVLLTALLLNLLSTLSPFP